MVRDSNSGHQLLLPPANWCLIFASRITQGGGSGGSYVNQGFDPARYPDPAGMFAGVKALHMHSMVTYWPGMSGALKDQMNQSGMLMGDQPDVFAEKGRELYYEYANTTKYAMGVDFSWLDSCDVGAVKLSPQNPKALNNWTGDDVAMAYGLMEVTAVADGYVRDWGDSRRMFALPRSSWAGMQRTGASMWSGDISGTWDSLRRQVAGSLNYQLCGNHLWSMDTGGYFHATDELTNPEYRQLLVRWHQFAAWTPVLRQHGRMGAQTTPGGGHEYYLFGDSVSVGGRKVVDNTTSYIKAAHMLRYRLLPSIYSWMYQVHSAGSVLQRALVMDFPVDLNVRQEAESFMVMDKLIVFPILQYKQKVRNCYLPVDSPTTTGMVRWYDFWTGETHKSGETVAADVTVAHLPLFVSTGAIAAMGPHLQYASEKQADPIELRVYGYAGLATSCNEHGCGMVLYEDDGKTMGYTRSNASSTIDIRWQLARPPVTYSNQLVIAARKGKGFAGMLRKRTFHIVLVRPGHGVGLEPTTVPDGVLEYNGTEAIWSQPPPKSMVKTDDSPTSSASPVDPPWPAGGALPALPRGRLGAFFMGGTAGQNDAAETARLSSLGIVGLGWQLGLRRADGSAWAVAWWPGGAPARGSATPAGTTARREGAGLRRA